MYISSRLTMSNPFKIFPLMAGCLFGFSECRFGERGCQTGQEARRTLCPGNSSLYYLVSMGFPFLHGKMCGNAIATTKEQT